MKSIRSSLKGAGTRLWPLSRQAFPKQLLPLSATGRSWKPAQNANTAWRSQLCHHCGGWRCSSIPIAEEARQAAITLAGDSEPEGRNIGPAILAGARYLRGRPRRNPARPNLRPSVAALDVFLDAVALAAKVAGSIASLPASRRPIRTRAMDTFSAAKRYRASPAHTSLPGSESQIGAPPANADRRPP